MQDRATQPIDLDQLDAQRKQSLEVIDSTRQLIETKFGPSDGMMEFMAVAFVGRSKRRVIGEDGKVTEVPWTLGDLVAATNEFELANEKAAREELAADLEMGFSAQEAYFTGSRSRVKERGVNAVRFGRLLVQRYLARELETRDRYRDISAGLKQDEETLDQLKGVLLPEAPPIVRKSLRKPFVSERLTERTGKEWADVLKAEEKIFLKFLQGVSASSSTHYPELADVMERVVRGGQRVYSDEQVAVVREIGEKIKAESAKLAQMTNFDQVLPWIKRTYGEDADYDTIPLVPSTK